jgi:hypothetical protein
MEFFPDRLDADPRLQPQVEDRLGWIPSESEPLEVLGNAGATFGRFVSSRVAPAALPILET